jgi:ATP-dependent DNA helicase RecQ
VLRARATVTLTRLPARLAADKSGSSASAARPTKSKAGDIICDEALFDRLRTLRRSIADELSVPAYIVFGDVTLREMARDVPMTKAALSAITGVGAQKLERFGDAFLESIREYAEILAEG